MNLDQSNHIFTWNTPNGEKPEPVIAYRYEDGFSVIISALFPEDKRLAALAQMREVGMRLPAPLRAVWPRVMFTSFSHLDVYTTAGASFPVIDAVELGYFHEHNGITLWGDAAPALQIVLQHELGHGVGDDGQCPAFARDAWRQAQNDDQGYAVDHNEMLYELPSVSIGGVVRQLVPQMGAVSNYALEAEEEEWAEALSFYLYDELHERMCELDGKPLRFADIFPYRAAFFDHLFSLGKQDAA